MERAAIDGVDLAYELHGAGEPVVLVHWGVSAAWAAPLIAPLGAGHRLLTYDRAGFGASGNAPGPVSLADHAAHCHGLMRRLGIDRAHVVGHSSSAAIALQLAVDAPDAVQTLALLEPARPAPQTETQAAFLREVVGPAVAAFRGGDAARAVDTWCSGVFGPGYRAGLDRALPGSFEQAVADAHAFFEQELPALQAWTFTEEEARRVTRPTLIVVGDRSAPTFAERRALLLDWLPDAEPFDLPGATHLLHVEQPRATADALAEFFARHPLGAE